MLNIRVWFHDKSSPSGPRGGLASGWRSGTHKYHLISVRKSGLRGELWKPRDLQGRGANWRDGRGVETALHSLQEAVPSVTSGSHVLTPSCWSVTWEAGAVTSPNQAPILSGEPGICYFSLLPGKPGAVGATSDSTTMSEELWLREITCHG